MKYVSLNALKLGVVFFSLVFLLNGCASTKASHTGLSSDSKALSLFEEGLRLLSEDPKKALELFDDASAKDKGFVPAYFNAGVALETLGRLDEAQKRYENCLLANKTQSSCLLNLVLVKAKLKDVDGARALADQYLSEYPDENYPKVVRAKLAFYERDYAQAEKLAKEVIERDAENVESLFIMAQIFYEKKQYSAAKFVLKNALQIAPSHGGMYLLLGHTDSKLDLLHDALDDYELAAKYQPTKEALESLGLLLLKRGRDAQGLKVFEKLVSFYPPEEKNYLHLGNAYFANRDFFKARDAYLRALELAPENKDIIFNLGLLYFEQKPEGLAELERVKQAQTYLKLYLDQKDLPKVKVDEVNGYLKILANKIEALEYVPEPLPVEEEQPVEESSPVEEGTPLEEPKEEPVKAKEEEPKKNSEPKKEAPKKPSILEEEEQFFEDR